MGPAKYPLTLYRGDTFRIAFKLWKDKAKTDPVDLTDIDVKAEVRDKPGGTKITPMTITIELPNTITAELSSIVTGTLPASGSWDLQLTYPSGDVLTILAGPVCVTADVTDSTRGVTAFAHVAKGTTA